MSNLAVVGLLLALSGLAGACGSSSVSEEASNTVAAAPAPAVTVDSARIEVRELQRSVEAIGTLDPNEEVTVSNQVEGPVSKVLVDLGDFVQAGQVLATIDGSELDLAVRQQTAVLQQEMARIGINDPDTNCNAPRSSGLKFSR